MATCIKSQKCFVNLEVVVVQSPKLSYEIFFYVSFFIHLSKRDLLERYMKKNSKLKLATIPLKLLHQSPVLKFIL